MALIATIALISYFVYDDVRMRSFLSRSPFLEPRAMTMSAISVVSHSVLLRGCYYMSMNQILQIKHAVLVLVVVGVFSIGYYAFAFSHNKSVTVPKAHFHTCHFSYIYHSSE